METIQFIVSSCHIPDWLALIMFVEGFASVLTFCIRLIISIIIDICLDEN